MAGKTVGEIWEDPRITSFGLLLEARDALLCHVVGSEADLPLPGFEVLLRLARSGGRLRMAELAAQVRLSTSGMTRLVDRLEQAGLVERASCPEDRRGTWAVLTGQGEESLRAALPAHLDAIQRFVVDPLGDDLPELESLLRRVRDHAQAAETSTP